MKHIFTPLIVLLLVTAVSLLDSCDKGTKTNVVINKCLSVTCANGGTCDTGSCICPSGFEGANCETISSDKFVSNWDVIEKGHDTAIAQYSASIAKGPEKTDLYIVNFNNYFQTAIKAYVSKDSLFIPSQKLQGKTVIGYGFMVSTNTYGQYGGIEMHYQVTDSVTNITDDFGYNPTDSSQPSIWSR